MVSGLRFWVHIEPASEGHSWEASRQTWYQRAIRDQNQLACYRHGLARYTSTVSNPDEIISKALQLPEDKRTQVALRLLDSLDAPDPHAHLTDDELQAELARRVQAVVDGTAELIPADQAIEQLRAELKK